MGFTTDVNDTFLITNGDGSVKLSTVQGIHSNIQGMINNSLTSALNPVKNTLTALDNSKQAKGNYQVANQNVSAPHVTTNRLCIGDVCISSGELANMKKIRDQTRGLCCFHEHGSWNDSQRKACLPRGDWLIQDMGLGDNITSLRCSGGVKARVYEHHFNGRSAVVNPGQTMDSHSLDRVGLNDRITTVRIRYDDEGV